MKQRDESYIDSLLENVSENSDNNISSMIDKDADSFQIKDLDLKDLNLDDLDLDDLDLDLSFDTDDDFAMDERKESAKEPDIIEAVDSDNSIQDDFIETPSINELPLTEEAVTEESKIVEEDSLEEPLSNTETVHNSVEADTDNIEISKEGKEASKSDRSLPENSRDIMEDKTEALESNTEGEEAFDPMGDVEDLLGMLAEEELGPEKSPLDDFSLEGSGENLQEDIFSLDSILDEEAEEPVDVPEEDISQLFTEDLVEESTEKTPRKKKKGIFQKLFGNIHDEKAKQANKKQNVPLDENGEPIQKNKKSKEEIKALKDAKKKEQEAAKKEKAAKKSQEKALKEEKKKEKAEAKKEKALEAVQEVDEGRINRVGAAIVFMFFGMIVAFIVLGTDTFSYSQNIERATEYFGNQKYNNAYNEVRGVKVKDKDYEIYDKIMTVMFVNKQFNSYNNYYNMEMYPEALDSLLKGLDRYDEYISIAKELGIKSDLDYVRNQILGELNAIFSLSESDSYLIINSDSQELYSQKVVEAASLK